jgi:ATP-dependent Zn protease
MTQTHAMGHCQRPWWKRPRVWFIGIAAVLALGIGIAVENPGKSALPYSTFLDQLEAGNVASVTVQGTEISGRFKHALDAAASSGNVQGEAFSIRVPDFGDPTLIPQLRKQHVIIEVTSRSTWAWLLGSLPWPMVIFVGVMLIAGLIRLVRGGKIQTGSAPSIPMNGPMGLVAGFFAKQQPSASPETRPGSEVKTG